MSALDAALWLARQERLPVFPCYAAPNDPAIDKTPATRHGFYDATDDPERIRRWWWRDRLIGVPTGQMSGFVILDIDPRHGGHLWEADNAKRLRPGGFPLTRVHRTQSGGLRYLFACDDTELRNSSSRIAPGVDVRANGGYCVWWPLHGCEPLHPLKLEHLAPWPRWLDVLAPRPTPPPQKLYVPPEGDGVAIERNRTHGIETLRIAVRKVAGAREGTRNDTLNSMTHWVADYVITGGLSAAEVTEAMTIAARVAGQADSEIAPTIRSALKAKGVVA
jgi:hypothetical protein